MDNVRVAFEVLKRVTPEQTREGMVKPRFKYFGTHIISDIKIAGKFTLRDRIVAGGHNTTPLSSITYSSVVTRESFRLEFINYGLNDIDIFVCNIGNA